MKDGSFFGAIIGNIYSSKRRLFPPDAGIFPKQIDIEVTNACNLDCIICPRSSMTRSIGNMQLESFQSIIDQVSKFGLEHMDLSLFGEPLLNPDLFKMARLAKEKGRVKCLYTSTNGLLLDAQKSRDLVLCGFDKIIVSIDGATKETYEKIRKKGNYEEVIEKTLGLINARKKENLENPVFVIQIIRMEETDKEIDRFIGFWKPHLRPQDVIQIKPYLTWVGKVVDRRAVEEVGTSILMRTPCLTYLWRNLAIYHNGDVTTCCYDSNGEMVVGNLKSSSIKEIWHSDKMEDIRKKHLKLRFEEFDFCDKCPFTRRMILPQEVIKLGLKHLGFSSF